MSTKLVTVFLPGKDTVIVKLHSKQSPFGLWEEGIFLSQNRLLNILLTRKSINTLQLLDFTEGKETSVRYRKNAILIIKNVFLHTH